MDDVLSKPLQLAALCDKLGQWLDATATGVEVPIGESPAELRRLFTQVSTEDLLDLQLFAKQQDVHAATQVMHRLLGVLPLFADDALLGEGERLFEALHGPDGQRALPELTTFAQRLDHLLAELRRT
jgi:hypothetical protein